MKIDNTKVDWNAFEFKSDDKYRDFEALCRSLVRLAFGGVSEFTGYKNQAGVEFFVKLQRDDPALGQKGSCVGWQCKYFRLGRRAKLCKSELEQIRDSYNKTRRHFPEIETWVLWTPEELPKGTIKAIRKMRRSSHSIRKIEFWDAGMIATLADVVPRNTVMHSYFGRLSLDRQELENGIADALAPIATRWHPRLHIQSEAESTIRRILLSPIKWGVLGSFYQEVAAIISVLNKKTIATGLLGSINDFAKNIATLEAAVETGRIIDISIDGYGDSACELRKNIINLVRKGPGKLRREYFHLQNLAAVCRQVFAVIKELSEFRNTAVIGVGAVAGFGKTHLAVSLASESKDISRPAGCLLLAKYLRKGEHFSEFIKGYDIAGHFFNNIDDFLECLDEVGNKVGRVIPIVIDGLNESENPSDWRDILSMLSVKIRRSYRFVKIIATYRSGAIRVGTDEKECFEYSELCLPGDAVRVEIDSYSTEQFRQISKNYATEYGVSESGIKWALSINRTPLFLKMFCEAWRAAKLDDGRSDKRNCGLSEGDVYGLWLDGIARKYRPNELKDVLVELGGMLWTARARAIDVDEFNRKVGTGSGSLWESRWGSILVDECVVNRFHLAASGRSVISPMYDRLGGYLIAKYLVDNKINPKECWHLHPLKEDVFVFFTPMWLSKNPCGDVLSMFQDEDHRVVLRFCLKMPEDHIQLKVVNFIVSEALKDESFAGQIFNDISHTVCRAGCLGNGRMLDRILMGKSLIERDRLWGVWVYERRFEIWDLLKRYDGRDFAKLDNRCVRSLFSWLKWLLSSNVDGIRDRATRYLCAMGEACPDDILMLIEEALVVDDPYIIERMMATAYATILYHGRLNWAQLSKRRATSFSEKIAGRFLGSKNGEATSNVCVLDYVINLLYFVSQKPANAVKKIRKAPFKKPERIKNNVEELVSSALHYEWDFIYKEIPWLLGRRGYDTDNKAYKAVLKMMGQRIYDLGFRDDKFAKIDALIDSSRYMTPLEHDGPGGVHKFSRKYARIAFYEMKGHLDRTVRAFCRWHELSLDPTFPQALPPVPEKLRHQFDGAGSNLKDWLGGGFDPPLEYLFKQDELEGVNSTWIVLNAYVEDQDVDFRRYFSFIDAIAVPKGLARKIVANGRGLDVKMPEFYYAFHGENPMSPQWWCNEDDVDYAMPRLRQFKTSFCLENLSVPVCAWLFTASMCWESYHSPENQNGKGVLLDPAFAKESCLRINPHMWSYNDVQDRLASVSYADQERGHIMHVTYIRADILRKYLRRHNRELVITLWGERDIARECPDRKELYQNVNLESIKFQKVVHVQL